MSTFLLGHPVVLVYVINKSIRISFDDMFDIKKVI